jgi:hypothetical protein
MRWRFAAPLACTIAWLGACSRFPVDVQVRPIYDLGAAGLTQVLQRLQNKASLLRTGAHPDDEDSAFLSRPARGDHARIAYLSLNRGERGQNIIGTELIPTSTWSPPMGCLARTASSAWRPGPPPNR